MGLSAAAKNERNRQLQLQLADAVEEHDMEAIRKLLPTAVKAGLKRSELSAAQHMLMFETQQALFRELSEARGAVRRLSRTAARAVGADADLETASSSDEESR